MSHLLEQDDLLALLYGEASPEEATALRQAIADDEELAAQWRQLQESHQFIAEQLPSLIEPPENIQETLLAAARQALPDKPYRPEKDERSSRFWSSPRRTNAPAAIFLTLIIAVGAYLLLWPQEESTLAQDSTSPGPLAMAVAEEEDEQEESAPFANAPLLRTPPEAPEIAAIEPKPETSSDDHTPPDLAEGMARLDGAPPKPRALRTPARAARPMPASPQMRSAPSSASPRVEAQSSYGARVLELDEPTPERRKTEKVDQLAEEKDLVEEASKAIDSGDFIAARSYLRKALAENDLPQEERERAEKLQQILNAIEDQMRVRPASLQ